MKRKALTSSLEEVEAWLLTTESLPPSLPFVSSCLGWRATAHGVNRQVVTLVVKIQEVCAVRHLR